jgi:hypothetical protein
MPLTDSTEPGAIDPDVAAAQLASPSPSPDQLLIMEEFRKNPYISNSLLAANLGLPIRTLEDQLKPLYDNEWIDTRTVVDLPAMGYKLKYRIDVKINPRELRKQLETLKGSVVNRDENPQVILGHYIRYRLPKEERCLRFDGRLLIEDIVILLGDPADLSITVRVQEHKDAFDWVTTILRTLDPVDNTSTCLEAWSVIDGPVSHETQDKTAEATEKPKSRRRRGRPRQ